ncbi:hypothetical protein [Scytonema sp. UIC 10036]|nr:hypothetical protein [Scytonema sp. UIC 10036]
MFQLEFLEDLEYWVGKDCKMEIYILKIIKEKIKSRDWELNIYV